MRLPRKNKNLSELVGIIMGDGYLSDNRLQIAGNSILDKEYLMIYVSNLVSKLFLIQPKFLFKKGQNTMYLDIRSRDVIKFLFSIGLEKSPKTKLIIPGWILNSDIFMRSFLRGMVDTDGSLAIKKRYRKIPYYPVISITSKNKQFIFTIANWLKQNGFSLWAGKEFKKEKRPCYNDTIIYRAQLSGVDNFKKWNNLIGFSNSRHIGKIKNISGVSGV